ncbi:hypothetical protein ACFO3D_17940 [Virgibacillus kekensis]|uniref:Uncharacterized protein n=1 Tax=Virgibacillus kekensis TaxID=202261 RepID=A0ABV9DNQ8_9BACI
MEVINQIYPLIDYNERDIFKRIGQIGVIKLGIQKKFPQVFDFLVSQIAEESEVVKDEISNYTNAVYEEGFAKLYENIDYSLFRDDIDVEKAIEIINWTMLGFGEKARKQLTSFEEVGEIHLKEWEDYSEILRQSLYK